MTRLRPAISQAEVKAILDANGVDTSKACAVAIRGYYLDSQGAKGRNDRARYDDAIVLWSPRGIMAYQANTDPSAYRKGKGTGAGKGMATLKTGIHRFGIGLHRGRRGYRQCEPFTVIRDGSPDYEDTGWFAIDIHIGGVYGTSSEGCQTIPPETWDQFRNLLDSLMAEFKNPKRKNDRGELVLSFDYVLIDETERRKGNLVVSRRYLKAA